MVVAVVAVVRGDGVAVGDVAVGERFIDCDAPFNTVVFILGEAMLALAAARGETLTPF